MSTTRGGAGRPGGTSEGPVEVRTRFERFPATIKGAFVLTSADRDPHAARLVRAEIARTPDGEARPMPFPDAQVNVAPRRDLFLPFEATIADLPPSWYVVRCEVQVDGGQRWTHASRPFSMTWPRSAVRTGTISSRHELAAGGRRVVIERVELRLDRAEILWTPGIDDESDVEDDAPFALVADDTPVEVLPPGAAGSDVVGARRRAVFYPVPRSTTALTASLRASPTSEPAAAVRLPLA
jgi:hypothetical protein